MNSKRIYEGWFKGSENEAVVIDGNIMLSMIHYEDCPIEIPGKLYDEWLIKLEYPDGSTDYLKHVYVPPDFVSRQWEDSAIAELQEWENETYKVTWFADGSSEGELRVYLKEKQQ